MDYLGGFPTELIEKILHLLSVQDLLSCSLVSKTWRSRVNMDLIWRKHCQEKNFSPDTIKKVDQTHFKENIDSELPLSDGLEPLCRWREIFSWHNRLRNNWLNRNYTRHSLSMEKCDSPVFCLFSNGSTVVSGHENASINIWNITTEEPIHSNMFFAALSFVPIVTIRIWEDYIVALQKRLLQIYKKSNKGYILKDAMTFELGTDNMSVTDKINILGDSFDYWYKECLRVSESGHLSLRRLVFEPARGLLLAAVGGSDLLEVWRLDGTPRASLTGFTSIRAILSDEGGTYIVSDSRDTLLSEYSFSSNDCRLVLRVPGWKKMVLSPQYLIAVPGRMDTGLKRIWVWDRGHRLIRTRKLSFGQVSVAPHAESIVYTEGSQVTVWNPKTDQVLTTFSAGLQIGFIKPCFSTLLVMFMNASVYVWDFGQGGKRLYRIYSELEWYGDFRDQLWLSPAHILAGGVDKQMELLSFKDWTR